MTTILDEIKSLFLDKVERLKDDEDGSSYWKIKDYIPGTDIDKAEFLLMDVSRIYRENEVSNDNKYYMKMSRMVCYVRLDYVPCTMKELLTELDEHLKNEDKKED